MTIKKVDPCSECGSRSKDIHHWTCGMQTVEQAILNHKIYRVRMQEEVLRNIKAYQRRGKQITFWQGKFAMVKHENNVLRKKVEKLQRQLFKAYEFKEESREDNEYVGQVSVQSRCRGIIPPVAEVKENQLNIYWWDNIPELRSRKETMES